MEGRRLKLYCPTENHWISWLLSTLPNKDLEKELFDYCAIEECDYILSPWIWQSDDNNNAFSIELCREAEKCNKRVIIFYFIGPESYTPRVPNNAILFSSSLFKSRKKANEFVMPPMLDLKWFPPKGADQLLRKKKEKPIVGFCGDALYPNHQPGFVNAIRRSHKWFVYSLLANPGIDKFLKRVGIYLTTKEGTRTRVQSLIPVRKNKHIVSNFIIREKCFNGVTFDGSEEDEALKRRSRVEYIDNMLSSDYILCPRGSENYSIRFYETLSSGRIPVFINTDCVLPFEDCINWKDYCIWVEAKEIERLPQIIIDYHKSISEEQLIQKQKDCRRLWEEWLSPEGFFRNFYRHFRNTI